MDPNKLEKFEAMNSYNKATCSKNPNSAFIVYILTALTCSVVFFSPVWYPSFESLINISLPNLISHLQSSPKYLFILSNLIIVFVFVGESKLLTTKPSQQASGEVYYHEYLSRSHSHSHSHSLKPLIIRPVTSDQYSVNNVVVHNEGKKVERSGGRLRTVRRVESVKGNKEVIRSAKGSVVVRSLSAEELSKRADDFIARVNRQRRLEATDNLIEYGT
ncbi:hypothetical protein QQ045_002263 [Rhodiola kirilowii]